MVHEARKATVESFITALFRDNESPKFIIDNYMYYPLNVSVPSKERETMISTLIDTLKNTHSSVVSSPGYNIVSYDEYKGEKGNLATFLPFRSKTL